MKTSALSAPTQIQTVARFVTYSAVLNQVIEMRGLVTTTAGFVVAAIISQEALFVLPGGLKLFTWHPLLMSMGAVGLSTAGFEAVRSRWTVGGVQSKIIRVQLHSALINVGFLMMLGGLYAIYANKERMGKQHWTTWHAYAGLLTLALWAANVVYAAAKTNDFAKGRLVFLWRSRNHRWLGAAAYAAGLVAVSLGLHSTWGVRSFGVTGAWLLTLITAAIFVGVISQGLGVIPSAGKKRAS